MTERLGEHEVRLRHRDVAPQVAPEVGGGALVGQRGEDLLGAALRHGDARADQLGRTAERLPVAGQDPLARVGRGGGPERRDVVEQRARAVGRGRRGVRVGARPAGGRSGWRRSAAAGDRRPGGRRRRQHRVRRAVAGPHVHPPVAPAGAQRPAVLEHAIDRHAAGVHAERARDGDQRLDRLLRHAVAAHERLRVAVVGLERRLRVAEERGQVGGRRHRGARAARELAPPGRRDRCAGA